MKPTITKLKDIRGRRIVGYRATIGPIDAEASTPENASEACEKATLEALARLDEGAKHGEFHGRAWTVMPSLTGWSYRIDGSSPGCIHQAAASSRLEAIDRAISHLAQNVWSQEIQDDDAFVRDIPTNTAQREIREWIRFQRRIIIARKYGLPDVDAFHVAGGMGKWPEDWEQVA